MRIVPPTPIDYSCQETFNLNPVREQKDTDRLENLLLPFRCATLWHLEKVPFYLVDNLPAPHPQWNFVALKLMFFEHFH